MVAPDCPLGIIVRNSMTFKIGCAATQCAVATPCLSPRRHARDRIRRISSPLSSLEHGIEPQTSAPTAKMRMECRHDSYRHKCRWHTARFGVQYGVPTGRHIGRRIVPCLSYFTVACSGCLDYVGEKKIQILTTKVGGAFIMWVNTALRNHCLEDVEWGLNQLTIKSEVTCSVHSESLRSMPLVFTTET